jgi:hypothetical protein
MTLDAEYVIYLWDWQIVKYFVSAYSFCFFGSHLTTTIPCPTKYFDYFFRQSVNHVVCSKVTFCVGLLLQHPSTADPKETIGATTTLPRVAKVDTKRLSDPKKPIKAAPPCFVGIRKSELPSVVTFWQLILAQNSPTSI